MMSGDGISRTTIDPRTPVAGIVVPDAAFEQRLVEADRPA